MPLFVNYEFNPEMSTHVSLCCAGFACIEAMPIRSHLFHVSFCLIPQVRMTISAMTLINSEVVACQLNAPKLTAKRFYLRQTLESDEHRGY